MLGSAFEPGQGGLDENAQAPPSPFSALTTTVRAIANLIERLRPLLRRPPCADGALRFGDVTLDPVGHHADRGDRRLELTPTEFRLLELFLRNPGRVLARSELYERVWGYDFGRASNTLGVHVGYLRRKLEADGEPRLIHTVRGIGYELREQP
jgi:two-component system response regulator MprA